MRDLDATTRTELEAAAFRRLVEHLRARSDWLKDAADARGVPLTKDESREHVYGMPYDAWKARHQAEATGSQLAAFEKAKPGP